MDGTGGAVVAGPVVVVGSGVVVVVVCGGAMGGGGWTLSSALGPHADTVKTRASTRATAPSASRFQPRRRGSRIGAVAARSVVRLRT